MNEILTLDDLLEDLQTFKSNGDCGSLKDVVNFELERIAKGAKKSNKKAEITIKMTFLPGGAEQMLISAAVNTKLSAPVALPLTAYTDERGRLYGEDPAQSKLPLEIKRKASI